MEPGNALVLQPNEPYRFGHPVDGGDECMVIALSSQAWTELVPQPNAFATTSLLLATRQLLRTAQFRADAVGLQAEPDAVSELALLRLAEVVESASDDADGVGRLPASRRRLALDAAAFVAEHHREPLPRLLGTTAAAIGCSPYHLARTFRAVRGTSLHAYRERLRVATALHLLRDAENLAELATSLGYAHHSHFKQRLRQAVGATPSQVRAALRGGAHNTPVR